MSPGLRAGVFAREVSVVVPVYNAETSLQELASQLDAVLTGAGLDWELILVNDGSSDQSWKVIERLAAGSKRIRGLGLMRNYGQHNALLCGIRAACGAIVVTMDDDLQHPAEEVPRLLAKLAEGHDVVYGYPRHERRGMWRYLASRITKIALSSTMGIKAARHVSAFRAFTTDLRDAFATYHGPFVSIDVLLAWGSRRFAAIDVEHRESATGTSSYTFLKLTQHALNMMTGFSTMPLQFASLMGFTFTLMGGLVLVYVVGRYVIQGGSVPGFPFLASIIAVFSGVQLFALGVIGEYLARMHFRMMDRPTYVVRTDTSDGTAEERDVRAV